jgi:hypothetical protein
MREIAMQIGAGRAISSSRRVYRAASRGRVDQADCDWRGG